VPQGPVPLKVPAVGRPLQAEALHVPGVGVHKALDELLGAGGRRAHLFLYLESIFLLFPKNQLKIVFSFEIFGF
jgi:hypothetical protein